MMSSRPPAKAGAQRKAVADAGKSDWTPAFAGERPRALISLAALTLLAACATQVSAGVEAGSPGFLYGLWHGFIFPVAWILSLFFPDVALLAVPNHGGWYDLRLFSAVLFCGVAGRRSHIFSVHTIEWWWGR